MMRASRYKTVYVIDHRTLKGFVSILPIWSGIDNQTF